MKEQGPIYSTAVREIPEEDRPRERLERVGPDALRDAELLAILFRSGTRTKGAVAAPTAPPPTPAALERSSAASRPPE